MFDNLYKQHRKGVLPKESWLMNEMSIDGLMRAKSVQVWWDSGFFQASTDFAARVNDTLRGLGHSLALHRYRTLV